jgi:hypothetical protein
MPKDIPNKMLEDMPDRISEGMSGTIPNKIINKISKNISDKIPKYFLNRMSKDVANNI